MDISRKTDYALRMLAMLADGENNLLSVRAAAEQVDVPYSFARSIQHGLVQAGIVESLRGVHGGMRLKADPNDVTIRQIVEAVQGPMVMNDCTANGAECPRMNSCCYHSVWMGAQALMVDYLDSVTLADVVQGTLAPQWMPSLPTANRLPSTFRAPKSAIASHRRCLLLFRAD